MQALKERIDTLDPRRSALLLARLRRLLRESRTIAPGAAREGGAVLGIGQARIWQIHREAPDKPVNVVSQIIGLEGPLDRAALARGLAALVDRHEALRTTFAERDGGAVQVIRDRLAAPLRETAAGPGEDLQAAADRFAREEAWRPFAAAEGPLVRFLLVSGPGTGNALVFTAHNLVFDAWSFKVLLAELKSAYEAYAAGKEPGLPPLPFQFADFAAWQDRWVRSPGCRKQAAYWSGKLLGRAGIPIPTDHPRPPFRGYAGRRLAFELDPLLKEGLASLGRQEGATLFMVLAAAVLALVARETGSSDVTVGTLQANRSRSGTEGVVGFLLNTLPLRADLSGNPDARSLVGRVKRAAVEAFGNADIPYERIVEELSRAGDSRPPFDLLFIFENIPGPEGGMGGVRLATRDTDKGTARYDLTLSLYDEPGRFHGWLEYDTDLYRHETADRLRAAFAGLLAAAAADSGARLVPGRPA